MNSIFELRKKIDELDRKLVKILGRRMRIAKKIGRLKKKNKNDKFSQERVEEIYRTRVELGKKVGLDEKFIRKLYHDLIEYTMEKQYRRVLIIDNYDSFCYNLYQRLGMLGAELEVFRNDKITLQEIEKKCPDKIILSPGPCTPDEAGISVEVVRYFGGKIPILGVCLGHQSIGQAYGGRVVRAKKPVHGKSSLIYHDAKGIFRGLKNPFPAGRYHSLIVERESLPDCLEISAELDDGTIMGLRHREFPVIGIQCHPESILTPDGFTILENFLKI